MNPNQVRIKLLCIGLNLPLHKIRRKMDTYLPNLTRNQYNNYRIIDKRQFKRLAISIILENMKKPKDVIEGLLEGRLDKKCLIKDLQNSKKVNKYLKIWIEEEVRT